MNVGKPCVACAFRPVLVHPRFTTPSFFFSRASQSLLVGSVTQGVVQQCLTPVVVVPHPAV